LTPADASVGPVNVTVTSAAGTSNAVSASLQTALPGLSVLANYVRAVRYPDGAIVNGTGAAETGYTTSAAVGQGDIIALFGTGFGPTNSTIATGLIFTGAYPTNNPVTVTLDGAPAEVLWAGLVGAGLYQINIRVPASISDGDKTVVATVAGVSSQSTAKLKVAASAKLSALARSRLLMLLAGVDPSRGSVPRSVFARPAIERLAFLGGLRVAAQHADPSDLAEASMRAAEEQGGIVQLA